MTGVNVGGDVKAGVADVKACVELRLELDHQQDVRAASVKTGVAGVKEV